MSARTPAPAADAPAIDVKAQLELALMHARASQRSFILYGGATVSASGLESLYGCINTIEHTLCALDPSRPRHQTEYPEDHQGPRGYVAAREHRLRRNRA